MDRIFSLNFLANLMHWKVLNGWSDESFHMLLKLLNEAFSNGASIIDSFYEANFFCVVLGLGCESIHACTYDYILYLKEFSK